MSKILIFTGSPQRDRLIDQLLKEQLEKLGDEVFLSPTPAGSRQAILDIQPDIMVAPPIRNMFSYSLCKDAARFGIAVAIRHVEPSCDSNDIKNLTPGWKKALLWPRPKNIKLELMWGDTERDYILEQCNINHNIVSVGAFVADAYSCSGFRKTYSNRQKFVKKNKLDPTKKILTISSPWGLLDIEADNPGQSQYMVQSDLKAQENWLSMVAEIKPKLEEHWDILLRPHPGLPRDVYSNFADKLQVCIDFDSPAFEVLCNSDALIHAGSTMAVEMHWLDKPSFQYGDVNSLDLPDGNWWQGRNVAISKISPFIKTPEELIIALQKCEDTSNANVEAIKELEDGRYGVMDGKATERAAQSIHRLKGKFVFKWPESSKNMDTLLLARQPEAFGQWVVCPICNEKFWITRIDWLRKIATQLKCDQNLLFRFCNSVLPCPMCGSPITALDDKMRKEMRWNPVQNNQVLSPKES